MICWHYGVWGNGKCNDRFLNSFGKKQRFDKKIGKLLRNFSPIWSLAVTQTNTQRLIGWQLLVYRWSQLWGKCSSVNQVGMSPAVSCCSNVRGRECGCVKCQQLSPRVLAGSVWMCIAYLSVVSEAAQTLSRMDTHTRGWIFFYCFSQRETGYLQ